MKCEGSGLPYQGEQCPVCGTELLATSQDTYPVHWDPRP